MSHYFHSSLLFGLLVVASSVCVAADPTRPPAAWLDGLDPSVAAEDAGLRLQSVKLPQRGKAVAVIGGATVTLGDKVGEARLIKLTEHEAVLQGADGVTHLYLTPDVEKQMVVTPGSRKSGKAGQGKDSR